MATSVNKMKNGRSELRWPYHIQTLSASSKLEGSSDPDVSPDRDQLGLSSAS